MTGSDKLSSAPYTSNASASPAVNPLTSANVGKLSVQFGLDSLGKRVGGALRGPFHAEARRPGSQLRSPSSPRTAYVDQKTYEAMVPVTTAAKVPARDFFAPKRRLGGVRFGLSWLR